MSERSELAWGDRVRNKDEFLENSQCAGGRYSLPEVFDKWWCGKCYTEQSRMGHRCTNPDCRLRICCPCLDHTTVQCRDGCLPVVIPVSATYKRSKLPPQTPTQNWIDRFWEKTEQPCGLFECWNWRGGVDKDGYGMVSVKFSDGTRRQRAAHRYAFFITTGVWPEELMHLCDNRTCVNPFHLEIGSHHENVLDCHRKKRAARNQKSYPRISRTIVQSVLYDYYCTGGFSFNVLGRKYGMDPTTAGRICTRKTWRDVPMPVQVLGTVETT